VQVREVPLACKLPAIEATQRLRAMKATEFDAKNPARATLDGRPVRRRA